MRNMSSFIMTLSLDVKKIIDDIQNNWYEKTLWTHLLNTRHFVAYGLIRYGLVEPLIGLFINLKLLPNVG